MPRTLPLLELAGLVLVALVCLAFQLRLPSRLPSEEDYRQVSSWLAAEAQPGDAVLLFPWWTERARLYLPQGLAVYGYWGSDKDDLDAHPRIWVLGQPELPRSGEADFLAAFAPRRRALGPLRQAGRLVLTLHENGRYRPRRFTATESFARAHVYLESPEGSRRECPFDGRAHRCPGAPHLYVAPEWHELRSEPRRCLWMHPPGGAERLVAEFPQVPAGTTLRLEGGIIFEYAYRRDMGQARMGVDDAGTGERLLEVVLPPGLEGVQRALRDLPPGPERPIKVWVQADNPRLRQVCLEVQALEPAAGGRP